MTTAEPSELQAAPGTTAGPGSDTPRVILVLRDDLPPAQAANAAAILAASISTRLGLSLGGDGHDASGTRFIGIVTTPMPILAADGPTLTQLFSRAGVDGALTVACLTEVARRERTYEAYLDQLGQTPRADSDIVALCMTGPRNRVTKLTIRFPHFGAKPDQSADADI